MRWRDGSCAHREGCAVVRDGRLDRGLDAAVRRESVASRRNRDRHGRLLRIALDFYAERSRSDRLGSRPKPWISMRSPAISTIAKALVSGVSTIPRTFTKWTPPASP